MKYVFPDRRSRGFTLVEMLVVIAIIVLLIALLMPTIEGARYTARLSACRSNLRQIATAHTTYSVDARNWYPFNSTQFRVVNGEKKWLFPTGTNPGASPGLATYFSGPKSMDPRVQKVLACPQGVADFRKPNNGQYYAFYANRINGQGNNQKAYYDTHPDGSWAATRQYVENAGLLLQKLGDTFFFTGYKNNFGWSPVNGEYSILASDWCRRQGVGGSEVITNHNRGRGYIQGTSYAVWTYGDATTNYAFTDGSVREFRFRVETFNTVMNMGAGTEGGAEPCLLPKAWSQ